MGSTGAFRLHSIVPFLQVGAVRMKIKVKFHIENSNLDHSLAVAVADSNDKAAQIGVIKETGTLACVCSLHLEMSCSGCMD